MSELKPCPFCGSTDVGGSNCSVYCYSCEAKVYGSSTDEAASKWNTRDTSAIEADELRILASRFFGAGYSIGYGGADIIDTPKHFDRVWDIIEAERIEKESGND